jgi:plastocyanin
MRRLLVSLAAVLVVAPAVAVYALASPGVAADGKLFATVGPGATIALVDEAGVTVSRLDPGTYTIEIDDRSDFHNFHLVGPGVSAGSTIAFVGRMTVTVTLRDGQFTYVCDAHAYDMIGQFTVGTPPPVTTPKPLPKLVATVGPGPAITLTRAGRKVTRLKAGTYAITVRDRSRLHNFHLLGPGVNRKTTVAFRGNRTWRVTLKRGLYRFRCDPHARQMRGSFRVP